MRPIGDGHGEMGFDWNLCIWDDGVWVVLRDSGRLLHRNGNH